ncbi:methyl-accepting chemotaxis sensory transducer with Pas/Pac sensor [Paraburkholderia unamae]|uniref:methyl-accepting chemotaxis protein n=1 Tax=Paraburkholderia unamae TaxID=219649 RepID=UPI000DC1FAB8|nr:PAS domain-containing methyl-accepting chemotaxis protein [Paraburkholderia unamae]RAR58274.1 methyl-accepting chemotaxis sensory transducer with Pas/Pac sensor [Paraburkholderia unamae]
MRENLPVTQQEYEIAADATLLSMTDTAGKIIYANAAFNKACGFSIDELLGQPHNLVRHPDMPPQAFADLWATLKAGLSWTALVKNRRKNGDHYWVRANATPVFRDGRLAGYLSVRTQPGREEVAATEKLYRDFRENQAGSRAFHQGLVVRNGAFAWMSLLQFMPLRWRIRSAMLASFALIAASGLLFGLRGAMIEGFAGTVAAVSLVAALWLEAQIARPLSRVLAQSLAVASGQSAGNAHVNRADEIGMLQRAVCQAGLNLRSLADDVSEQLGGLRDASADIATRNKEVSRRSEEAAASLEQTAASMEQMTATVKNNAGTAALASELAGATRHAAAAGSEVVGQVVATMGEIAGASKRISEIIGIIDGIAFQTNILALNAAVEAARAGHQGRGFAVVAAEVRTLAQRSANAAKEIATLINDSVRKTTAGSDLASKAGDAMKDIMGQVTRAADLIHEISLATKEQSEGIGQVNLAIAHLDQVTQQNARMVHESAAAAGALGARTQRLEDAVAVFEGSGTLPRPVARPV